MNIKTLFNQNETPTIEEYLKRCGVEDYENYINPPHNVIESYKLYDNIDMGAYHLERAISLAKEHCRIILVCDSDCDGYCATTIAYQFLIDQGVSTHDIDILFHTKKQHGFSDDIMEQIKRLLDTYGDTISLIWMPDAGTNDEDACAYYDSAKGIPVLITDHHVANVVNNYAVVVNNQTSDKVKNKHLCGAGVTHKLITAYCNKHNNKFHQSVLDLVALATIGDVCDIRNLENRMIVKWGLSHVNNPFLKRLYNEYLDGEPTPTNLAWNVIPKINAVCRNADDDLKIELFDALAMDYYSDDLIARITKCHTEQREQVNNYYEMALGIEPIGDKVKIIKFSNTPYTGLIASKLSEHYNAPCMVVHPNAKGELTGSLRSPCPLRSQLASSGLMTICAGHEQSCGVGWKVKDTEKLSSFCRQLDLTPAPKEVMYSTDNVLMPKEIFEIAESGSDLWGHGIPEPTIHVSDIIISGKDIKEIGASKTTIKFLYGDVQFIGFFMSKEKKESLNVGKDIMMNLEIIGTPSINRFNGNEYKQVVIKEWEIK